MGEKTAGPKLGQFGVQQQASAAASAQHGYDTEQGGARMTTATATPSNEDEQRENEERRNQFIAIWAEAAARVLESARNRAEVYAGGLFGAGGTTSDSEEGQNAGKADGTRADGDAESL